MVDAAASTNGYHRFQSDIKQQCVECGQRLRCDRCDTEATPKWEKVLYKKQPFDDNHVDAETFLNSMVTNGTHCKEHSHPCLEADASSSCRESEAVRLLDDSA